MNKKTRNLVLFLCTIVIMACGGRGPSVACKRACSHVQGQGHVDCIAMCEATP